MVEILLVVGAFFLATTLSFSYSVWADRKLIQASPEVRQAADTRMGGDLP
jgi:hypothetical protein